MDAQLKRGLLEVCVLAALKRGDSYGYRIVREMPACLGMSESTLYPILKRLETAGCLTEYSVEHAGRLRRFYSLTPPGHARIEEFAEGWGDVVEVYNYIVGGDAA